MSPDVTHCSKLVVLFQRHTVFLNWTKRLPRTCVAFLLWSPRTSHRDFVGFAAEHRNVAHSTSWNKCFFKPLGHPYPLPAPRQINFHVLITASTPEPSGCRHRGLIIHKWQSLASLLSLKEPNATVESTGTSNIWKPRSLVFDPCMSFLEHFRSGQSRMPLNYVSHVLLCTIEHM